MSAQVKSSPVSAGLVDLHECPSPGSTVTIASLFAAPHQACGLQGPCIMFMPTGLVASQGLLICQGIIGCGTEVASRAWAITADGLTAFSKLQHDRYEDSDSESGSSDSGTASEDVASWISWFCSLKGNEFFCEVRWPSMSLEVLPLLPDCSRHMCQSRLIKYLPGMQLDLVSHSLLSQQPHA